jgi:glucosyl-3-phosphoglycerate synthase
VDTIDDPADDTIASLSVVIPARNEATTIAAVVTHALDSGATQVLVVDGDSTDATATEAAGAGAEVVRPGDHFRDLGPVLGKGDALWRALPLTTGSTVAFLDGDLTVLDDLLPRLLAALARPGVVLAKADIRRLDEHGHRRFGRVSQFTARPLLSLLFPELDHITEPLSGQVAAGRDLLMTLPFEPDYGLEVGMLLAPGLRSTPPRRTVRHGPRGHGDGRGCGDPAPGRPGGGIRPDPTAASRLRVAAGRSARGSPVPEVDRQRQVLGDLDVTGDDRPHDVEVAHGARLVHADHVVGTQVESREHAVQSCGPLRRRSTQRRPDDVLA